MEPRTIGTANSVDLRMPSYLVFNRNVCNFRCIHTPSKRTTLALITPGSDREYRTECLSIDVIRGKLLPPHYGPNLHLLRAHLTSTPHNSHTHRPVHLLHTITDKKSTHPLILTRCHGNQSVQDIVDHLRYSLSLTRRQCGKASANRFRQLPGFGLLLRAGWVSRLQFCR